MLELLWVQILKLVRRVLILALVCRGRLFLLNLPSSLGRMLELTWDRILMLVCRGRLVPDHCNTSPR